MFLTRNKHKKYIVLKKTEHWYHTMTYSLLYSSSCIFQIIVGTINESDKKMATCTLSSEVTIKVAFSERREGDWTLAFPNIHTWLFHKTYNIKKGLNSS